MARKRVVVIGGGQGGLSAAIYSRLKGHEVILLERGQGCGGKARGIEMEGYQLDPGPSILILTDVYRKVFEAAGKAMEDYLEFQRLDPFTRVILEGEKPLDLPAGREECIGALAARAPQDEQGLRTLMSKLEKVAPGVQSAVFTRPIHQIWQLANPNLIKVGLEFDVSKTYRQLVDSFFQSDLLRAFFYGFPSYSGNTYHNKAAAAFLIPYFMIQSGVWTAKGGVAAIPAAFERLARELGVEIVTGCDIAAASERRGRIVEVTDSQGRTYTGDWFISNLDRVSFETRFLGRVPPARPSFSYYTLHWGIRRELPELQHHTLLIPKGSERGFEELYTDRRPSTRPIVYLNSTPAPAGKSCVFAVATVPAQEEHLDWVAESERLKGAIKGEMATFGIPIREEELDFEREQSPLYFEQAHGNWKGTLYGPDEEERLWKLLPLRCKDEMMSNLLYSGGAVQPGAGLPMVTLSGMFAAGLLPKGERS